MKMTQFYQIVEPSLKLIGRKFGNGRRLATGGGGFRPQFKFACTQFYAQHTHLILSSIFHWSSLNRHDQKFDSFSLQCRHTGRRRHKTRLQLRFCPHLMIIFFYSYQARRHTIDCSQGSTVIFHCEAGGVPRPSLTWTVKSGLCHHHHRNISNAIKVKNSHGYSGMVKSSFLPVQCALVSEESDECWGQGWNIIYDRGVSEELLL